MISSPNSNDNEIKVAKAQVWTKVMNSFMESMWKNIRTNFGSKGEIENTSILDSFVMTTCMLSF